MVVVGVDVIGDYQMACSASLVCFGDFNWDFFKDGQNCDDCRNVTTTTMNVGAVMGTLLRTMTINTYD